jgi:hypothetical protein
LLRRLDRETHPERWLELLRNAQRQFHLLNRSVRNVQGVPV